MSTTDTDANAGGRRPDAGGPAKAADADAPDSGAADAAARALSTAPVEEAEPESGSGDGPAGGPRLGVLGWARWFWRQLTSMRVALILLFLLSLAAIPGSIIPQTSTNPVKVSDFLKSHSVLGPVYTKLGLFHVYSSVWFSAIYILLFVSLAGCILPRSWQFIGQLRGNPPRAPRKLDRMPAYATWVTDAAPDDVLSAARGTLRRRRYRVAPGEGSLAAEKGYLREAGNLVFHIALFGLLIAFAWGTLWKSDGTKLVVPGPAGGFTNNQTQYDDLSHGALFNPDDMAHFGLTLDDFHAAYQTSGPTKGTPTTFYADVTYFGADNKDHKTRIRVNDPLNIEGNKIYLTSHGYAMNVTVKDGKGDVAYSGPVPFLPEDGNLTSQGVIKVPDAVDSKGKPEQLGFAGLFTPTTTIDPVMGPQSTFPALKNPTLFLTAYYGDLGMDAGLPQNVYVLDTASKNLHQFTVGGQPLKMPMVVGDTLKLPNGAGSITLDGVSQWADFEIVHQPGIDLALGSALAMLVGLAASLFIQRRRIWVRALPGADGRTVVELAGLGRTESPKAAEELARLVDVVHAQAPSAPEEPASPSTTAPEDSSDKEHA
ncbi:cytochrome c biogenesis protein ResB [Streptantibioticus parmotrematis]|uniref:cytochrome c biogenesis protein ResB n=1 Tax=Streptantibioticus parmotrematis TaxID=2873249 RepID=UPI0033FB222D